MHGLKSAILAIFQKSAHWLDWQCPVSAALQNRPQDLFFSLFSFNFNLFVFFKYETIVRSSASSFGHSDPDPDPDSSSVYILCFNELPWKEKCLCQVNGFNQRIYKLTYIPCMICSWRTF